MKETGYSKLKHRFVIEFIGLLVILLVLVPFVIHLLFNSYGKEIENGYLLLVLFLLLTLFLVLFFRSRNFFVFLFTLFWLGVLALAVLEIFFSISLPQMDMLDILILIIFIFTILYLMIVKLPPKGLFSRYLGELLDLAASPVEKASNGYSNRPYPGGKFQYSQQELLAFARFMQRRLIATVYEEKDRILMVFSNGLFQYIPFIKPDLKKVTYVVFDFQGNVTLHMSRADYDKYQLELAFDQLCRSFAQVMVGFFKMFREGKKKEIIKSLKEANLNPSEFLSLPIENLVIKTGGE